MSIPEGLGHELARAAAALAQAGCESPRFDAELLLAHVLGVDRGALIADRDRALPEPERERFRELVGRRENREPVAYITGTKGFRFLDLDVDPRVLIPRPETETLVEAALVLPRGSTVLDVGTGSGAVALALKHERPDLQVTASDVSADALAVARANAERLRLDVTFVEVDGLAGFSDGFDAIISNPPYVADGDREQLAPEITRHEPALALFAGRDGLDVLRRLATEGRRLTGWLAVEVGAGQAGPVAALMIGAGFLATEVRTDLAGIPRVVVAR